MSSHSIPDFDIAITNIKFKKRSGVLRIGG